MRRLALVLAFFCAAAAAEEKVVSFHSDVRIAADGWMTVTETIDINVENRQIKRGILRDFPTDYLDRRGRKVTVPFEVVSVRRDGRDERYALERKSNGASVRIGDPGSMLAPRRHVYEITYRTRFQVGFFDAHDELYWNVNGNGWTFAMDAISAAVTLPRAVPAGELKAEAYTGAFAAKDRDYRAATRDGGADFAATRRMAAGEGMTIVLQFPKGVVLPPTAGDNIRRWLHDNLGEAVGAAGLLLMAVLLYWYWSQVGRDPRAGPPFPRYEAPKDMGPAGVRYLDQMGYDDRCFAAGLLGLAQRGFLRIREDRESFELERTGAIAPFTAGDVAVAGLVPKDGPISIGGSYDARVQMARVAQSGMLEKEIEGRLYSSNRGALFVFSLGGGGIVVVMSVLQAPAISMLLAGALAFALLIVGWRILPAYTIEGRRRMDEIDGLRQYLSVAEKDDLARQKRPPRSKEEFAKFLPYAVALGVEKTWADAFTKVLGASAVAAAASSYYASSAGDGGSSSFSGGGIADSLGSFGDSISSASTPPGSSSGGSDFGGSSSSGSSGGGSSGGGGGGGGGSGW